MSLAEAVFRLRKARGWTQIEYAQAIVDATGARATQGTITNVEHGRHDNPSDRMLKLLAAGLGISVPQLRREAGLDPISDELEGLDSEFIQELRKLEPGLSPEARTALIVTARQMQRRDARRDEQQRQRRAVPAAEPEQPTESRELGENAGEGSSPAKRSLRPGRARA